jgi:acyl-coenzyme A thioesterase PaaI-like protein
MNLSADAIGPGIASPVQTVPLGEPLNPACFVCGEENPHGLHLAFQTDGHRASATWTPRAGWESYKGIIHGGVISSVLDEAMSKAILSGGSEAFTADLRIRFRKKICVDDIMYVRGWVVSVEKRKILAEASITSEAGEERTHAWGVFLVARHS